MSTNDQQLAMWTDGVNLVMMPKGKKPKGREWYRTEPRTLESCNALFDRIQERYGVPRVVARALAFPVMYGRRRRNDDEIVEAVGNLLSERSESDDGLRGTREENFGQGAEHQARL
jgi:hypothetical protein